MSAIASALVANPRFQPTNSDLTARRVNGPGSRHMANAYTGNAQQVQTAVNDAMTAGEDMFYLSPNSMAGFKGDDNRRFALEQQLGKVIYGIKS